MKMTKVLIIALGAALALTGGIAAQLNSKLENAQVVIESKQSTIANQKLAIDGLASEVVYLGSEVDSLVQQSELTAALNAEHERQTATITATGNDWLVNSNELQVSEHEPTRTWAAAALPDDALRLLSEASRSQGGDGQATDLHSATFKHGQWRLPPTSI